jgi:Domain of unknown function (DUF4124)
MIRTAAAAWSLMLSLLATSAASAQSVWRCQEGGRVLYQAEPCRGGRAVEAPVPRPTSDEAEAARIAERHAALAERLAAERRARETQPMALAAGIAHSKTELSRPSKPRLKTKHPPALDAGAQTWRARTPSSRQSPG